MPQARRAGSSPSNPAAQKSTSVRPAAGKPAPARSAAAHAGAATPAASRPAARAAATKPTTAKRSAAKPAAKKQAAKPTASKGASAKPAATKTTAAKRPAAKKSAAAKPSAAKSASAKTTSAKTTSAKSAGAKSAGRGKSRASSSSRPRVNIDGAQVEAIAERLRKLNERIIDFGREAGENTLASYEKALKTIANGLQQSPAKDELEWISHLAASQAKFVRELTDSWAKAARDRLK